ncbi:hypothetical protein [Flavobacterium bizetiae]|uniref:Uncharacterized protein n=1 Tax=Flavobacterium bizetiae TaxID=2704140 RepID=A0A6J4GJY1_9FLAO|nr:hypothetical protein [Flavobacterium bizetiae]UTN05709.1 hypothetical protein L0669_07300 [Flavobacterium bizetiae]CAA9198575.1 hypothetical protein FLA105534_02217 [Flavobacterium bizetiae]CAD5341115.1 hypothetical protein FLA105535_01077 [Flavobacterium bizetiae]CAD5347204.1 hypothetical protein FLA105534_01159 [Flavobacterium bizetiae]
MCMFNLLRKRPRVYSKIENHIFGIITELLKLSSTDINSDELGGKYYLSNEEQHFKVTIMSNDYVIRLTNTRDSVAEKYDKAFVEDVLKAVKEEKHRRMEVVYDSINNSIEKMAERLHNTLIESNELETQKVRHLEKTS